MPCAFVNRQMFFGTFDDTLVVRLGGARVAAVSTEPGRQVFSPRENAPWADYVQVQATEPTEVLRALAAEALAWAAALPVKGKKPKVRPPKRKAATPPEPW